MTASRTSSTDLANVVAENVRALREKAGWSLEDMRQHLAGHGWPTVRTVILKVESRQRQITVDELAALAAVFHVEPWSLTQRPTCDACLGSPPPGYSCLSCGASRAGIVQPRPLQEHTA